MSSWTYTNNNGQTECTLCEVGKFQGSGSVECEDVDNPPTNIKMKLVKQHLKIVLFVVHMNIYIQPVRQHLILYVEVYCAMKMNM